MARKLLPSPFGSASAIALGCALIGAVGCQGNRSELPPVHLIQNMDFQQRFDAQEVNDFFKDVDCANAHNPHQCEGRAARLPVAGTVAVGQLHDDDELYRGRGADGRLIDRLPAAIKLSTELMARGEERYNIYCQPCHDYTGGGQGIATLRGGGFSVAPKNLNDPQIRAMPLGHFFDVITNGKGTMQPYAAQISAQDRWAITVWVRTLQVARTPEEAK
ncbi:c-type cytochrome [Nannocystis pusilla]|uniref:Cytochrome c n=1 Tax=Nannocystis pusilla TaxID=889268 RepID=A0ABS7TRF4_9BACT|nr:cytochrome c [Nannocystis pusilla]MBZ5710803.1 cytochrome c [Nannocystis pusilla]